MDLKKTAKKKKDKNQNTTLCFQLCNVCLTSFSHQLQAPQWKIWYIVTLLSTPSSEVSLGKKISQKFYCPVTPFVPIMFPAAASGCQSLAKGMQMLVHFTEFRHLISCLKH